jgi:hypothetical protein
MTPDEQARLRVVELWQGRHEEKCEGRHVAISGRFDRMEELLNGLTQETTRSRRADDAATVERHFTDTKLQGQNWLRLAQTVFLAVVFLAGLSHHPKALFDLLDMLP